MSGGFCASRLRVLATTDIVYEYKKL